MDEPQDSRTWWPAPPGWTPDAPNPFTTDGAYGSGWSCFQLTAADDDVLRNGRRPNGCYVASLGRRCPHPERRLRDFLPYEARHGRCVVVAGRLDFTAEQLVAAAFAVVAAPTAIREDDPRWVVHSTSRAAWAQIQTDGELRAGACRPALGERLLGDPPDYAEYVALGPLEAIGPEYVVACRQAERMLPSPDTEYEPGARLYFDAHRIIRDGLAVRDGLHSLKVHGRLPLRGYLVHSVTVDDLPSRERAAIWTTTAFLQQANEAFRRHVQATGQHLHGAP